MTRASTRSVLVLVAAAAFCGCASSGSSALQTAQSPPTAQPAGQSPYLVLYRRGPNYDAARSLFEQKSIQAHIAHHEALGERLISAGPLRGAPDGIVGAIAIYARDPAEAEAWLRADPAITSGVLTGTIAPWSTSEIRPYRRPPRD